MENKPYAQLIGQVNGLTTTDRTGFLSQLPQSLAAEDKSHLAIESLDATKDGAKIDILTNSINNLSPSDKQAVSDNIIGKPSEGIRDRIWMVVIWAFVVLIVGSFLTLTASLFSPQASNDARVQIILTVFTTAAAFLTGLLAPSPMSTKQGN